MNAGAWGGEISNCLESVELIDPDTNEVITVAKSEIDFSYRSSSFKNGSILLSALFNMDYSDKQIIEDNSKVAQFGRKTLNLLIIVLQVAFLKIHLKNNLPEC